MEDLKKILNLGLKHPARTMEFAELKKGLFEEVDKGNINVIYHPDFSNLAIFKYSIDCVADRNWNKFTLMARGLILDLQKEIVVATPFVKFFNLGEIESGSLSIIEPDFVVSEKIDGSLCIMFNFANKWRVATAGSFVSDQALWATKWMKKYMSCDQMDITNTYLFEVVYPENKIVVQYNYEGLVLLSIIDQCGLEYSVEQLEKTALSINTRCVEFYNFSDMDSILKNVQTLGINQEGYVIRFSSGIRLKVKGDEYVRIHKLISRVTPLAIWEALLNGDNLEEIKKEIPEEMQKDFNTIVSILCEKLTTFIQEVETLYNNTKHMSDKDLGICISQHPELFQNREFKGSIKYVFPMRKNKFYDALNDYTSLIRRRIFNIFKPKANILKGYTPSSLVTRFSDNL